MAVPISLYQDTNLFVHIQSGTSRNQPTHDHVLFEPPQMINFPGNTRFGQNAGGLLEGSRGNETLGAERGLGDSEKNGVAGCRLSALGDDMLFFFLNTIVLYFL